MTTITYKYQITVPKKVREKFEFKKGDILIFAEEEGKLILTKSTEY